MPGQNTQSALNQAVQLVYRGLTGTACKRNEVKINDQVNLRM